MTELLVSNTISMLFNLSWYSYIWNTLSIFPSIGNARCYYIIDDSIQILICPILTIHTSIPTNYWEYTASTRPNADAKYIPVQYAVLIVVSILLGSFINISYASLTSAWTYCEDLKFQAVAPFTSSNFHTYPPIYIFGGPTDSTFMPSLSTLYQFSLISNT